MSLRATGPRRTGTLPARPRRARPALRAAIAGAVALALMLVAPRLLPARTPGGEPYALVAHPSTAIAGVSEEQLRRIFLGEQQFWPGGQRIVLLVHGPGSDGRALLLRQVYRMSEGEFKRYWIAKIFRDDVSSGPKIVGSSALARSLTAAIPGAVSVIPLSQVDATVKVLRIERRPPATGTYLVPDER